MARQEPILREEVGRLHRREDEEEAGDLAVSTSTSLRVRSEQPAKGGLMAQCGMAGVARRTLGIILLLVTVFLWTASNFMNSFIFADDTYDNAFFVTYVNTSAFAISLVPAFYRYLRDRGARGLRRDLSSAWFDYRSNSTTALKQADEADERLLSDAEDDVAREDGDGALDRLGFRETAVLSLEFCMLWFTANYFSAACLKYTSVASVTILTSTSSAWTLVFCAMTGIEQFTTRKVLCVGASLAGVALISTIDLAGQDDEHRGTFPEKTAGQIAYGDLMALFSAVIYGMYITLMKRRVGNEDRVDMQLFFGLVGVFNLAFLWPFFFVLHWTGLETFEWPPTGQVWIIIIFNSLASFLSDISWAYAMLMTTPLVVTVGLSLNIPLSLVGEMLQYNQYPTFMYWIGAAIVCVSFLFVNKESEDVTERLEGAGAPHND